MLRPFGADCPALPDMLTRLKASLAAAGIGGLSTTVLAHAGYFLANNVTAVTEAGMDPLLATGRLKHGQKPAAAPRGRISKDLTPKQRMTRKLQTLKGKTDYSRRKAIVEPVFGQMKVAQHAGQFRLQGTDKTDGEWALHTFGHNLRKLQNAGWTPQMVI